MTPEEKDALIRTIREPGADGTHGSRAAKARLEAALATEVTAVIEHAQTVLGTRLAELAGEIKLTREAMRASSDKMENLTSALVTWTRVSVVVIAVYTLLMGIMVWLQFSPPHS